jgi:poly(hydroxyalkanoate) depolymerase family esterase
MPRNLGYAMRGMRSSTPCDSKMIEATRLVRAGRLTEATALIQGRGAGSPVPQTAASIPPLARKATPRVRRATPYSRKGSPRSRKATSRAAHQIAPPGTVQTKMHHSPAGNRPYRLYVPSAGTVSTRPLVVMLHGGTQDGATFAHSTGMDAVAEEHGLLVAYPEQVTSANPMRYWNWFSQQHRTSDEPAIIASVIAELVRTEGADPTRVYVAGFSAGAAMAAVLASTHPDVVAAVGIHSGLAAGAAHDVASAFTAMRSPGPVRPLAQPVPAITFHGDADPTVSITNSARLADQFGLGVRPQTEQGGVADGRNYTVHRHHMDHDKVALEQWVVHGMAHAWSGGATGGSYTDPTGPDASAQMVRFFLSHHA